MKLLNIWPFNIKRKKEDAKKKHKKRIIIWSCLIGALVVAGASAAIPFTLKTDKGFKDFKLNNSLKESYVFGYAKEDVELTTDINTNNYTLSFEKSGNIDSYLQFDRQTPTSVHLLLNVGLPLDSNYHYTITVTASKKGWESKTLSFNYGLSITKKQFGNFNITSTRNAGSAWEKTYNYAQDTSTLGTNIDDSITGLNVAYEMTSTTVPDNKLTLPAGSNILSLATGLNATTGVGYTFTIQATATAEGYDQKVRTETFQLKINKADPNINFTIGSWDDSNPPYGYTSKPVRTINCTSDSGGAITYEKRNDNSGNFTLDTSTGKLELNSGKDIGRYECQVRATVASTSNYNAISSSWRDIAINVEQTTPSGKVTIGSWTPSSTAYGYSVQPKALLSISGTNYDAGTVSYTANNQTDFDIVMSNQQMYLQLKSGRSGNTAYKTTVSAMFAENSHYESGPATDSDEISITVGRADLPNITITPPPLSTTYGYTADVTSSNTFSASPPSGYIGTVTYSITQQPTGDYLSIDTSNHLVLKTGHDAGDIDYKFSATFSQTDNYNARTFSNLEGTVNIQRANLNDFTIVNNTTATYWGSPGVKYGTPIQTSAITFKNSSGTTVTPESLVPSGASISAEFDQNPMNCLSITIYSGGVSLVFDPSLLRPDSVRYHYKFRIKISGNPNYNDKFSNELEGDLSVEKADLPTIQLKQTTWDGSTAILNYSECHSQIKLVNKPADYAGVITYSIEEADDDGKLSIDPSSGVLTLHTGARAGQHTYRLKAVLQSDDNYNGLEVSSDELTYWIQDLPPIGYFFDTSVYLGNKYGGRLYLPWLVKTYASYNEQMAKEDIITELVPSGYLGSQTEYGFDIDPNTENDYGNFNATFTASPTSTLYEANSTITIPCTNAFTPIMSDNNTTIDGLNNFAETNESSFYGNGFRKSHNAFVRSSTLGVTPPANGAIQGWFSIPNIYEFDGADPATKNAYYIGSDPAGGEWISIHMLTGRFYLKSYDVYSRREQTTYKQFISEWHLQGSNNGTDWNDLAGVSSWEPPNNDFGQNHYKYPSVQPGGIEGPYSYFRLVVTKVNSTHGSSKWLGASCGDLVLFGYPA